MSLMIFLYLRIRLGCQLFEYVAEFAEYSVLGRFVRRHVRFALERLDGLFLLVGEVFRNVDHDVDKLVACSVAFGRGETLATQTEHLAGLCACGDFQSGASVDGRNLYGTSEGCCRDVKHKVVDDIVAVADKFGVLDFLDDYEKVAVDSAVDGSVALTLHCEGLAVGYTCGDVEGDGTVFADDTFAVAEVTLLGDDFAFALTLGTLDSRLRHSEECLLLAEYCA